MSLKGKTREEQIWNYLLDKIQNEYGVAGVMGNLYAESAFNPINLQNSYEKKLKMSDIVYTTAVDRGTYTNFAKDKAGYGLCQWAYWSRKEKLLQKAKSKGVSIGDLELQLDFLYEELSTSYRSVLVVLKTAKSVSEASKSFMLGFERPANKTLANQKKRAEYCEKYYSEYAGKIKEEPKMPEVNNNLLDNVPNSWAVEAVEWAKKNKILLGDEKGNLKLHSGCTRENVLVFLERYHKNIR